VTATVVIILFHVDTQPPPPGRSAQRCTLAVCQSRIRRSIAANDTRRLRHSLRDNVRSRRTRNTGKYCIVSS